MKKILKWQKPTQYDDGLTYHDLIPIDGYYSFGYIIEPKLNEHWFKIYDNNYNNIAATETLQEAKDMLIKIVDIAGCKVIDEDLTIYL